MTLDVVNADNQKVGTLDLNDDVFAGHVKTDLIWESVVRQNASERRGTHKTKNRALVSGGGKKPYKQKGTGRAQVGSTRSPLWRHGGTVFGPSRAATSSTAEEGAERRAAGGARAEAAGRRRHRRRRARRGDARPRHGRLLQRLGATGKTLVVDVKLDDNFLRSARNIAGVKLVSERPADAARRHGHDAHHRHARGGRAAAGDAGVTPRSKSMKPTAVIRRPLVTEKTTERARRLAGRSCSKWP